MTHGLFGYQWLLVLLVPQFFLLCNAYTYKMFFRAVVMEYRNGLSQIDCPDISHVSIQRVQLKQWKCFNDNQNLVIINGDGPFDIEAFNTFGTDVRIEKTAMWQFGGTFDVDLDHLNVIQEVHQRVIIYGYGYTWTAFFSVHPKTGVMGAGSIAAIVEAVILFLIILVIIWFILKQFGLITTIVKKIPSCRCPFSFPLSFSFCSLCKPKRSNNNAVNDNISTFNYEQDNEMNEMRSDALRGFEYDYPAGDDYPEITMQPTAPSSSAQLPQLHPQPVPQNVVMKSWNNTPFTIKEAMGNKTLPWDGKFTTEHDDD